MAYDGSSSSSRLFSNRYSYAVCLSVRAEAAAAAATYMYYIGYSARKQAGYSYCRGNCAENAANSESATEEIELYILRASKEKLC